MLKPMTIILIGAIIVVIGGITGAIGTYLHNKKSSAKTDKIISFQNELIEKSEKLIQAQNENQIKSDSIISLQNKLHEANEQILLLSNENIKQVLGNGEPTLSAHFYPDKRIALFIGNNNQYPIYDININFPNPDHTIALNKMIATNSNLTWEDMRNQWIYINPFNLSPGTSLNFYSFDLPTSLVGTSVFLNISSRHGAFSGRISIERDGESFKYSSEVKNMNKARLSKPKK
jgi:hypothetical protein